ncbi:type I-C CRISPR-associated endonuclease Cas1c [Pectinatus haikarae]|uniref:CRISPR-associated endonuclease Cas1 n=1 Tax=Pectinatus haikarae TaxID=349096 RepID=A0ABT9YBH1_9FIRM|nr:type I-C CRISPR-associated endonuclease Cas1c [Pectinatus haikarae]MDQ0204449.1 CRISPR-associated protein Cas1 [Pectinatus haikarae]
MKPLLNTLFVNQDTAYLSLDGENIVVLKDDKILGRFPLHNFEQITTFGYIGASPALMKKCAEKNIALNFMTPEGRFMARVIGKTNGNVLLRKEQYRWSDSEDNSLNLAKCFIAGKLYNSKWVLERTKRDHPMRVAVDKLQKAIDHIQEQMQHILAAKDMDELRGIEGKAAVLYFSVFDDMILNQKENFFFKERNKRPPLDNMNCLLSFIYALLANDIASALEGVGLDSYVGFLHRDRPGRQSLAFDMMEEFRPILADRVAVTMVNRKKITENGFIQKENGAVLMTDDARKLVLEAWHTHKEEQITHPFLEEKIKWGLVPHVQAILLARCIRNDLDTYPPFLWK